MTEGIYNYREQIIFTFWELDRIISNLFNMGFNIGLEEEWHELKEAVLGPDPIPVPIDLEYLRAINHRAVPGIIEMIEILVEVRNSLININLITEEELGFPPDVAEDEEEVETENSSLHYLDHWVEGLFTDYLGLFENIWALAYQTELPEEMYDEFTHSYYEKSLKIDSNDQNVCLLMDGLNRALDVNRRTEFFV